MNRISLNGKYGKGYFTVVDDGDFEYLNQWSWLLGNKGYVIRYEPVYNSDRKYKTLYIHRVIMAVSDKIFLIDHINHEKLDNRRSNLRICTTSQNCANMNIKRKNRGISGFKGVRYHSKNKNWNARITIKRKEIHLGCFTDKDVAAKAYDLAAIKYFGEFALTNFSKDNYV